MDRSQSLNVPPYFDGNNCSFWKVRMRAFLCSIDDTIWDVVDVGWTRPEVSNRRGIKQPLRQPMLTVKL